MSSIAPTPSEPHRPSAPHSPHPQPVYPASLGLDQVKTGDNPTLTPNQSLYLQLFQIGGHVYTTDERITRLAHTPNVPFPPMDVYILYAPGPNLPYAVAKLPPPKFHKSVVNLRGHLGT